MVMDGTVRPAKQDPAKRKDKQFTRMPLHDPDGAQV